MSFMDLLEKKGADGGNLELRKIVKIIKVLVRKFVGNLFESVLWGILNGTPLYNLKEMPYEAL